MKKIALLALIACLASCTKKDNGYEYNYICKSYVIVDKRPQITGAWQHRSTMEKINDYIASLKAQNPQYEYECSL